MSKKFLKNWERESKEPILSRIKGTIHPGPPIKDRLTNSIYRLQVAQHRLESTYSKMEQKDRELFDKCTNSMMTHDQAHAAMYANETAEVRKMAKIVLRGQLAIEQVVLRLETVRDFGDVVGAMAPVVPLVQAIKGQLMGVMPEVSYELSAIGETLNSMVIEAGEVTGTGYDTIASGQEAQKIMVDANVIAEQRMKERFPELPVSIPTTESEKTVITR